MADKRPARVVILGGGFGGMYAALEFERILAGDGSLEVTLVNEDNFFPARILERGGLIPARACPARGLRGRVRISRAPPGEETGPL